MALDLKDQPRESFFDYDVTDSGYDMTEPYQPRQGVGLAAYLMVTLCALIVITWLASTIAGMIA
jgi:peptide deformylase